MTEAIDREKEMSKTENKEKKKSKIKKSVPPMMTMIGRHRVPMGTITGPSGKNLCLCVWERVHLCMWVSLKTGLCGNKAKGE